MKSKSQEQVFSIIVVIGRQTEVLPLRRAATKPRAVKFIYTDFEFTK